MSEDDIDRIVQRLRNVYLEVTEEFVTQLVPLVTNLNYPENPDDIETATEKICNFLIESDYHPNSMPVAALEDLIFHRSGQTADNDAERQVVEAEIINIPPNETVKDQMKEASENEQKLTNIMDSLISLNSEMDISFLNDIQEKITTYKSLGAKARGVKKEQIRNPTKQDQTNFLPEELLGAVGGVALTKETEKNDFADPDIVFSIPELDRTVTDVDVLIECACCYNEFPFDYLVQCPDGHLFCCQCLERYANESVYGHGKGELICMVAGCTKVFARSQLSRALPTALYTKYEERIAKECVNTAALENFVSCKFCSYGAELDPAQTFFICPKCEITFCRKCQELFKDHEGLSCEQVEKDGETKIRTTYEEKMAETKIRTCSNCKARFTKDFGCNKIVCRCGTKMCYICRMEIRDYSHFCQHPHNEKATRCQKCNLCKLYTNAEQDDNLAIDEMQKEAQRVRDSEGFGLPKEIGVPKNLPELKTTQSRGQRRREVQNVALQFPLPPIVPDQLPQNPIPAEINIPWVVYPPPLLPVQPAVIQNIQQDYIQARNGLLNYPYQPFQNRRDAPNNFAPEF